MTNGREIAHLGPERKWDLRSFIPDPQPSGQFQLPLLSAGAGGLLLAGGVLVYRVSSQPGPAVDGPNPLQGIADTLAPILFLMCFLPGAALLAWSLLKINLLLDMKLDRERVRRRQKAPFPENLPDHDRPRLQKLAATYGAFDHQLESITTPRSGNVLRIA